MFLTVLCFYFSGKSSWQSGDLKWYFFCPTERKYPTGVRTKRTTECGYWKATGNDRSVLYNGEVAGKIKTLVFHTGRAPKGDRTDWVMHEYRLESKDLANRGVPQVDDTLPLIILYSSLFSVKFVCQSALSL